MTVQSGYLAGFNKELDEQVMIGFNEQKADYEILANEETIPDGDQKAYKYNGKGYGGIGRPQRVTLRQSYPERQILDGYEYEFSYDEYGIAIKLDDRTMRDNINYLDGLLDSAEGLGKSLKRTIDELFFDYYFNSGDVSTPAPDGKYLYSASHTFISNLYTHLNNSASSWSNYQSTATPFTFDNFEEECFQLERNQYDHDGYPHEVNCKYIVVPRGLKTLVSQCFQSDKVYSDANNAIQPYTITPIYSKYLTENSSDKTTSDWYLLGEKDKLDGPQLNIYWRMKPRIRGPIWDDDKRTHTWYGEFVLGFGAKHPYGIRKIKGS